MNLNLHSKVEIKGHTQNKEKIWEVLHNDVFVIGSKTLDEAEKRLHELDHNGWKYLNLNDANENFKSPINWIATVREMGWEFHGTSIDYCSHGRVFFHGQIAGSSVAFRYLVLDFSVAETIKKAVPEALVR